MKINPITMNILQSIRDNGGKPYIVGGFVRDLVMGFEPKDLDIEVYNMNPDQLKAILSSFGEVNEVGMAFGILKVDVRKIGGDELDFSLPRLENKSGNGHKGFIVTVDSTITPEMAASRRDFTMNSMFYDPFTGEIYDPFHGQDDIKNKIIRHTSIAYKEDPLRVLRAMQFSARFGMKIAYDTAKTSNEMLVEFDSLPVERITGEFMKLILKGKYISLGLKVLVDTGWIVKFPELNNLINTIQDPEWHPEGNVWNHTLECVDVACEIAKRESLNDHDKAVLILSAMCHDMGKFNTTSINDVGHIISHGHESAGVDVAHSFLNRIGVENSIIENVLPLVGNHMRHLQADSAKTIRRLTVDIKPSNIKMLSFVIESDHSGRGSMPKGMPIEAIKMVEIAESLNISDNAIKPLIMGRHLIEYFSMKPSIEFRDILAKCFEAQINGEFDSVDSGIIWIKENIKNG